MYIVIETTTDNKRVAKNIVDEILKHNLSPCIHTSENITSNYVWKNKTITSKEILIRIKTNSKLMKDITKIIKKLHNYDNPELISYKIDINSDKYNKWFDESIKK